MQLSFPVLLLGAGCVFSAVLIPTYASEDPEPVYDPIMISAEQASQGIGEDSFKLTGQLRVNTREWVIRGNSGIIEGRIDDSDFVTVQGEPAEINYNGDNKSAVSGTAEILKYSAAKNAVKLSGSAKLLKGDQSVESDAIEYFLNTGTWSAGNISRVKMIKMVK